MGTFLLRGWIIIMIIMIIMIMIMIMMHGHRNLSLWLSRLSSFGDGLQFRFQMYRRRIVWIVNRLYQISKDLVDDESQLIKDDLIKVIERLDEFLEYLGYLAFGGLNK